MRVVKRNGIKLPAVIKWFRVFRTFKIKILKFRPYHKICKSHLPHLGQIALEHIAGIAGIMPAFRSHYVAEHYRALFPLNGGGKLGESVRVRKEYQIRLINPGESFNGRPIQAHALFKSVFQFSGADGYGFQLTKYIHKTKLYELYVLIFYDLQYIPDFIFPVHLYSFFLVQPGLYPA